jgi:hypothetical protein
MDDNLLGYLLNALDPETQRDVSRYLHAHPEARTRLERLRQALAPLEADRAIDPPPRLAERTLARVEEFHTELPRAPITVASRSPAVRFSGWRWADALVAACVLLVSASLLLSLRSKLVYYSNLRGCENNQQQFWFALQRYRDRDARGFPNVADEPAPLNVAGISVPVLVQAGVLSPDGFSVYCPSSGQTRPCPWSLEQLQLMSDEQFRAIAPELMTCYAYSLGYREGGDQLFGPRSDNPFAPILADRPPPDGAPGNSPNHGGLGQNVLLVNGQVRYCTTRALGDDDDIYSNRRHEVRAGIDRWDTVLGSSADRP